MESDETASANKLETKRVLEAVSILTALSFPASALVHSLVFMTWNLDFAAIASAEDVVMGGFRLLWLMLLTWWIGSMMTVSYFLGSRGLKWWSWSTREWIRETATLLIPFGLLGTIVYAMHSGIYFKLSFSRQILPFAALVLTAYAAIMILTSIAPLSRALAPVLARRRTIFRWSLLASILILVNAMARSPTNLVVYNEDQLPIICQSRAGHRHLVWWTGSRSSVVQCAGRLFVVLYSERPLVLESVPLESRLGVPEFRDSVSGQSR